MSSTPAPSPGTAEPPPAPAPESSAVRVFASAASDLRHAFRLLRKAPGFTSVTLLTLALCIGANTAIFSAVYALMLKPLPFPHPERIVEIYNEYNALPHGPSNPVQYTDYKEHAASFDHLGLWMIVAGMYGDDTSAEFTYNALVTADFFDVVGVKPLLGQFFTSANSRVGEDKVIVLTESFWASKYAADPEVIGRTVRFDGESYTIIGVAPREVEAFNARMKFFRPLAWPASALNPLNRHGVYASLYGRLKPGVSVSQAQAEAEVIEHRYYDTAPAGMRQFLERSHYHVGVGGLSIERVKPVRSTLLLLQGGVVFVLLIGCVNVANLLLARANGRQSELAIRFALGASRAAIARQLLLESALLTGLGTLLGLGVAWAGVQGLNHYRTQLIPAAQPFTIDGRVLAFAIAVAVAAAVAITIVPLVHLLRANLAEMMQRSSRSSSGGARVRTLSSILIVGQVAIALVLLSGAGLLIHSFINAISVDPGLDPRGVVVTRLIIPRTQRSSDAVTNAFLDRLVTAMREIPGVSSAALATGVPFRGGLPINAFTLEHDVLPPGASQPGAFHVEVSPDYLATVRLRLLAGRFIEAADRDAKNDAFVVDEAFANKYFPPGAALGGRFYFGPHPKDDTAGWCVVVGIVRPVPHNGVEDKSGAPFIYRIARGRLAGINVFLRTDRPADEVIPLVRAKLHELDPETAIYGSGTLQSMIDSSFEQRRGVMLLLGTFAGLALFLSAIGIYGVLAYDVAQRTREIGVRGAIGATHHQVIGLILRQGLWKTGLGVVLGLIGAVLLSRYLQTLLFHLSPGDPWAYAAVSGVLLAVAALASYLPARRAAKINPVEALRDE